MDSPINSAAIDDLRLMCGDDADTLLPQLIEAFVSDAHTIIANLHESLATDDLDGLRTSAHNLISSARSFGAAALSDDARRLETLAKQRRTDGAADLLSSIEAELAKVLIALQDIR